MNMWNNVVNAWWSIVFYPATDAPRFRKGMIAMICTCVATLGITWIVYTLERREWLKEGRTASKHKEQRQVIHTEADHPKTFAQISHAKTN